MTKDDSTQTPRVALLIDADNVNASYAGDLLTHAAKYGDVIVRKGYGGLGQGFPWKKESMLKFAIEPVARYAYVSGKNVADIALVIDAMDLTYRKIVDVICLASNDSDFSLLAMKLREKGIKVYGFGEAKALAAFVSSCDGFVYLSGNNDEDKSSEKTAAKKSAAKTTNADAETKPSAETPPKLSPQIKRHFSDAYDNCGGENGGWVDLGEVAKYMQRIDPAFSPKKYGFSKLKNLVESTEDFHLKWDNATSPRIKKKD